MDIFIIGWRLITIISVYKRKRIYEWIGKYRPAKGIAKSAEIPVDIQAGLKKIVTTSLNIMTK